MNSEKENYQKINELEKNEEILYEEENKILEENAFLPNQVEKYLNVINNNIILINMNYRICLNGEI